MLGDRREEEKSVRGPKRSIAQSRRDGPRVCLFRKQGRDSRSVDGPQSHRLPGLNQPNHQEMPFDLVAETTGEKRQGSK